MVKYSNITIALAVFILKLVKNIFVLIFILHSKRAYDEKFKTLTKNA